MNIKSATRKAANEPTYGTIYARYEPSKELGIYDYNPSKRDVVLYEDSDATIERTRFFWYQDNKPRKALKTFRLGHRAWSLQWIQDVEQLATA